MLLLELLDDPDRRDDERLAVTDRAAWPARIAVRMSFAPKLDRRLDLRWYCGSDDELL